jgi:hypothetical protein
MSPSNFAGSYTPLHPPGSGLLPKSVQGAATAYQIAATKYAEAQTRLAALESVNAAEAARQRDVQAFKTSGKTSHKFAHAHAQDVQDAQQEVDGLSQLAVDAESTLIGAARAAERPEPSDLSGEREAVAALAQTFAMSRIRSDVSRWLDDPTKPFTSAGLSPLERALQAVRDELEAAPHLPNMFRQGAPDLSPLSPGDPGLRNVELPGGERRTVAAVANSGDPVEGIR